MMPRDLHTVDESVACPNTRSATYGYMYSPAYLPEPMLSQLQEVTGVQEADDLADLFIHFGERIFDLVKEINICSA